MKTPPTIDRSVGSGAFLGEEPVKIHFFCGSNGQSLGNNSDYIPLMARRFPRAVTAPLKDNCFLTVTPFYWQQVQQEAQFKGRDEKLSMNSSPPLLAHDEPPAVVVLSEGSASPFVLICDHASNRLPRSLGTLGVEASALESHIAWDLGAAEVTRLMASALGAFAILQNYSRLVIDCNRNPDADDSIIEVSEYTEVPANKGLSRESRIRRLDEIFHPYHTRLKVELDRRREKQIPTALVSLHTFTPVYKGQSRPAHVGVLYNRDDRLAVPFMRRLQQEGDIVVGDNTPYALDDTEYTIPVHGEQRGLHHVEIEIRQDLLADRQGQQLWAERLMGTLESVWQEIPH